MSLQRTLSMCRKAYHLFATVAPMIGLAMLAGVATSCAGSQDGRTAPATNAGPTTENPLQDPVDKQAQELMNSEPRLKGLVVAAAKDEHTFIGGYGDTGKGQQPDGDTVFRIASVTKPLTGLLVASFVTAGQLSYSDPVVDCTKRPLKAFCSTDGATTWVDLLTHYSGLPASPERPDFDPAAYYASYKPASLPGEKFNYSTAGYAAIGWALEQRFGQPYDALLRERILTPLGMASTVFELPPKMKERSAPGHRDGAILADEPRPRVLWPSGALYSTANDLLRFLATNLHDATDDNLSRAAATTQQTLPERATFPPSIAAKGWQYFAPLKIYWHSGTSAGHSAVVAFSKEKKASVVLLTNTGIGGPDTRLVMAAFALLGKL